MLVDEISRCKPEHQNRLFSLVHERRVQGIALEKLRYRWAAMNPAGAGQDGGEYLGSEPLDPALADRFAIVIEVGDWSELSEAEQRLVANPAGEGSLARDGGGCVPTSRAGAASSRRGCRSVRCRSWNTRASSPPSSAVRACGCHRGARG